MNVRIYFFGMVAEAVNSQIHIMENFDGDTLADVETDLVKAYPQLGGLSYQLALDKKLVSKETPLNLDNEVAVLPPFAGG